MLLAVAIKHLSNRFHVLTQLCAGGIEVLTIMDLRLDPHRDTVRTILCKQFTFEELGLEHTKGHIREILFPQVAHANLIDAATVANHHIRCQRTEAAIDRHGVVIEILDKIAVLGKEFFLDFFGHVGIAGCKHSLGTHYQHREAVCFLQILCQQEQTRFDAIFYLARIKQITKRIRRNQQITVLFLAVHPVQLVKHLSQLELPQFAHAVQTLEL